MKKYITPQIESMNIVSLDIITASGYGTHTTWNEFIAENALSIDI